MPEERAAAPYWVQHNSACRARGAAMLLAWEVAGGEPDGDSDTDIGDAIADMLHYYMSIREPRMKNMTLLTRAAVGNAASEIAHEHGEVHG